MTKFRAFIIFIIAILTSNVMATNDSIITYDEFVHLNFNQKTKTILMIHNYLNEFERTERFKRINYSPKYSKYKNLLESIVKNAHANEGLKNSKENCFYAGWPSSFVENSQGKLSYCNHPYLARKVSGYNAEESKKFMMITLKDKRVHVDFNSNGSCKSEKNTDMYNKYVECNPQIYGQLKGRTFCVDSGQKARNASYLCSEAIRQVKDKDEEEYNTIMQSIISANTGTDNALKSHLKSMFNTCICGANATDPEDKFYKGKINKSYSEDMYYSRTCHGILSQVKRIKDFSSFSSEISCSGVQNTNSIGKTWEEFITSAEQIIDRELEDDSQLRQNISNLSKLRDWKRSDISPEEIALICPLGEVVVKKPKEKSKQDDSFTIVSAGVYYDSEDKTLKEKITPTLILSDKNIEIIKSEEVSWSPITAKKVDENSKDFAVVLTSEVQEITALHTPSKLSTSPLAITALEASCTLELNKTDSHTEVTLNFESETISKVEESELNIEYILSDFSPLEGQKNVFSSKDYVSTNDITGSINFTIGESQKLSIKCLHEASEVEQEEKISELASCSIKLEKKKNGNGQFDISAIIDIVDKDNKEHKGLTSEEATEFGVILNWYDSSQTRNIENKKSEYKTPGLSEEDIDSEDEDEKKRKKEDQKQSRPEAIPKSANNLTKNKTAQDNIMSVANVSAEKTLRTIYVHMKHGETCDTSDSISIEKLASPEGNNKPVQQKLDTSAFEQGNGFFIRGTR